LGATRSYPTDAASLLTLAEIVTAHASKEVTETTLISAAAPPYQTYPSPFHNEKALRETQTLRARWL